MRITEVEVKRIDSPTMIGFASITFDKVFKITSLAIRKDNSGKLITIPPKIIDKRTGREYQVFYPLCDEFEHQIVEAVQRHLENNNE